MSAVRILSIDCSTDVLSVACGDGSDFAVRDEHVGPAHAERALPRIRELLALRGWALGSLDAIAFGAGPGSFTGVRIACGIAQGLALGAGLGLVPVGTLEALAQEAWRAHGAAEVFACRSTVTTIFSCGKCSFFAVASMIRRFAWCGISQSMVPGARPAATVWTRCL